MVSACTNDSKGLKVSFYNISQLFRLQILVIMFTKWPNHIPFIAVAFIPLLNGK